MVASFSVNIDVKNVNLIGLEINSNLCLIVYS